MDTRPQNCRFRLADEKKPYPRSSCYSCGKNMFTLGKECQYGKPPTVGRENMSEIQKLKSWAHFYDAIVSGDKKHDLRYLGDRNINMGDHLILQRYDNINGKYTGEEVEVKVTYITDRRTPCAFSSSSLDKDYAILSIEVVKIIT